MCDVNNLPRTVIFFFPRSLWLPQSKKVGDLGNDLGLVVYLRWKENQEFWWGNDSSYQFQHLVWVGTWVRPKRAEDLLPLSIRWSSTGKTTKNQEQCLYDTQTLSQGSLSLNCWRPSKILPGSALIFPDYIRITQRTSLKDSMQIPMTMIEDEAMVKALKKYILMILKCIQSFKPLV